MADIGSTKFSYEEREVQVITMHLASGEWDVEVRVTGTRKDDRGIWVRSWTSPITFKTKDEALSYGSAYGKKLIDDGIEEPSDEKGLFGKAYSGFLMGLLLKRRGNRHG